MLNPPLLSFYRRVRHGEEVEKKKGWSTVLDYTDVNTSFCELPSFTDRMGAIKTFYIVYFIDNSGR